MTGPDEKNPAAELRGMGKALIDIANALDGLDRAAAIRVLRAAAILNDVDLEAVGLKEIGGPNGNR